MLNIDPCARRLFDRRNRNQQLLGRLGRSDGGRCLETGQSRWFDATVGRWLSEDPLGLSPDVNPDRYCGNAPTDGRDPSGTAIINSVSETAPSPYLGLQYPATEPGIGFQYSLLQQQQAHSSQQHDQRAPAEVTVIATPVPRPNNPKIRNAEGGVSYAIKWSVSDKNANGWIVQHVISDRKCNDKEKNIHTEAWEAWQVVAGVVYVGKKEKDGSNRHHADTFIWYTELPGFGGTEDMVGRARFIPNDNPQHIDPSTWGEVSSTGPLPATEEKPSGWDDTGAVDHELHAVWCDIPNQKKVPTTITGYLPAKK